MEQENNDSVGADVSGSGNSAEPVKLDANKYAISAFLFLMSFGIIYVVGSASNEILPVVKDVPFLQVLLPIPTITSYMYILMPFAGFFFMFFLVDWVNDFFKDGSGFSPLLPTLFFVLSLLAFYIAIFWYIGNYAQLQGGTLSIDEAGQFFAQRLRMSAYYLFVLAGMFGWVSRSLVEKIKL